MVDRAGMRCYNIQVITGRQQYGGIAQLGERLNGIQEVSGSIPLISTKKGPEIVRFQDFFLWLRANKSMHYFLPAPRVEYLLNRAHIAEPF